MKIKPHFFHGIYSNGYFPDYPALSSRDERRFYASKPLHANRAILGSTDPFNPNYKVIRFKTEEEALTWYKKSRHGKGNYDKIKSEGQFCKNYFKVSENNFYKFSKYLNGMVKSVNIKSNAFISINGDWLYIGGTEECPGDSSNGTWSSYHNYYIDSNTELILNDENLENRLGAKYLAREFVINTFDPETEKWNLRLDSARITDLAFLYTTTDANAPEQFKDAINDINYIYNREWEFKVDNLKRLFNGEKKFLRDRTLINDPLATIGANYYSPPINLKYGNLFTAREEPTVNLGLQNQPFCAVGNRIGVQHLELDDPQKQYNEISNNWGTYSFNILNSNAFGCGLYNVSFAGTVNVYIESLKIYLCFFELDIKTELQYEGNDRVALKGGPNTPQLFTTSDGVSTQKKPSEAYYGDENYFPVEKVPINIIVGGEQVEIEVWKMSQNNFYWSINSSSINTPWFSTSWDEKCIESSVNLHYFFNQPFIEVKVWQQEDFDKNLVFPEKLN